MQGQIAADTQTATQRWGLFLVAGPYVGGLDSLAGSEGC